MSNKDDGIVFAKLCTTVKGIDGVTARRIRRLETEAETKTEAELFNLDPRGLTEVLERIDYKRSIIIFPNDKAKTRQER